MSILNPDDFHRTAKLELDEGIAHSLDDVATITNNMFCRFT